MKRGSVFSFHVTVVIAAIAFIYFSTVFVFIDEWFGLWSSPGMLNAVFFTVVAVMCIYNYALAIYTDPGQVPSSFVPDVEHPDHIVHEIKRKVLGPNVLCWPFPSTKHIDSGLRFRTSFDSIPGTPASK
ncbi:putative protein S-acyltransferase 16 [Capsicum chinense]|nr:putative protein S-acyltransferase 16 [Capsicum chinense]